MSFQNFVILLHLPQSCFARWTMQTRSKTIYYSDIDIWNSKSKEPADRSVLYLVHDGLDVSTVTEKWSIFVTMILNSAFKSSLWKSKKKTMASQKWKKGESTSIISGHPYNESLWQCKKCVCYTKNSFSPTFF